MVVADPDGVVIAPFAQLDAVAGRIAHITALERELDEEVRNGLKIAPRIEALLNSDQVSYE